MSERMYSRVLDTYVDCTRLLMILCEAHIHQKHHWAVNSSVKRTLYHEYGTMCLIILAEMYSRAFQEVTKEACFGVLNLFFLYSDFRELWRETTLYNLQIPFPPLGERGMKHAKSWTPHPLHSNRMKQLCLPLKHGLLILCIGTEWSCHGYCHFYFKNALILSFLVLFSENQVFI